MLSGDDHSHHPRQGHALKWTTEEICESLAGLCLALNGYKNYVIQSWSGECTRHLSVHVVHDK